MKTYKLDNPIEYDLKDYTEPLFYRTDKYGGFGTHEALISHSAFTLAKMWQDGFKWKDDLWGEIMDETPKAILVSLCAVMWWIPKRLIKKVRRIREVK